MMKRLFIGTFICLCSWTAIKAQAQNWYSTFGSDQEERVWKVKKDSKGNIYVLGNYTKSFSIETEFLVLEAEDEFFLAKFDKNGNITWVRTWTGIGLDLGTDIVIGDDDLVYVSASFFSKARINNDAIFGEEGQDGFIMQLSEDGFNGWIRTYGGTRNDHCYGLYVDGNVIFGVGGFEGSAPFESEILLETKGASDMWIGQFRLDDGFPNWVIPFGSTGDEVLNAVVKDFRNDLYVIGSFEGEAAFGNRTYDSGSGKDLLLGKVNFIGNPIWSEQLNVEGDATFFPEIEVDEEANIYLTGKFKGNLTIKDTTISSADSYEGFLFSINANGGLRWIHTTNTVDSSELNGTAIFEDKLYVTGSLTNGTAFGSETIEGGNGSKAILAEFDLNGNINKLEIFDGSGQDATVDAIAGEDNVYTVGTFKESIQIGDETINSTGDKDIFLMDLDPTDLVSDINEVKAQPLEFDYFLDRGNQKLTVNLSDELIDRAQIFLIDANGRVLLRQENNLSTDIDLSSLSNGIYFLSVRSGKLMKTVAFDWVK